MTIIHAHAILHRYHMHAGVRETLWNNKNIVRCGHRSTRRAQITLRLALQSTQQTSPVEHEITGGKSNIFQFDESGHVD